MFSKIKSCMIKGIDGYMIEVETDIAGGMPSFEIVGLGDIAVKEAKERVRAAIKNSGFEFPVRKITLNLSPANERKVGSSFDLAIAVGILAATNQVCQTQLDDFVFIGELSLDGSVKATRGVLSMAICVRSRAGLKFVVPVENFHEASVVKELEVIPVNKLSDIIALISNKDEYKMRLILKEKIFDENTGFDVDFSEVRGHRQAKRGLEVAAAGAHNLLMLGGPGCGKTMLAKRLPTILPRLTFEEALEVTKIHSVAGILPSQTALISIRPFRNPHHSITEIALIGGGNIPKPGEISLAHFGVLFLDELPEFSRKFLEMLRQPLEDGYVTLSRLNYKIVYPAFSTLICTANPCKCGKYFDDDRTCTCTPREIQFYRGKISGPLLDRIDIQLEIAPVKFKDLDDSNKEETSEEIGKRVENARKIQFERYKDLKIYSNSQLQPSMIEKFCKLDLRGREILGKAFEKLGFTARSYSRILRVSRTIADMEESIEILPRHVAEAINYRTLDRRNNDA